MNGRRVSRSGHGSGYVTGYNRGGGPIRVDTTRSTARAGSRLGEIRAGLWTLWLVTGWPAGSLVGVVWLLHTLPTGPDRWPLLTVAVLAAGVVVGALVAPILARLLLGALTRLVGPHLADLAARGVEIAGRGLRTQRMRPVRPAAHVQPVLLVRRGQYGGRPVLHVQVVDLDDLRKAAASSPVGQQTGPVTGQEGQERPCGGQTAAVALPDQFAVPSSTSTALSRTR